MELNFNKKRIDFIQEINFLIDCDPGDMPFKEDLIFCYDMTTFELNLN